jgi:hypothetical protein
MMWVIHTGYIKAALQVIMGKDAYFFVKSAAALGWRIFHPGARFAGFWLLGSGYMSLVDRYWSLIAYITNLVARNP